RLSGADRSNCSGRSHSSARRRQACRLRGCSVAPTGSCNCIMALRGRLVSPSCHRDAHPSLGGGQPQGSGRTPPNHWRSAPVITEQRREILKLLERLSELTPDVRFGQLIANLSYLAVAPTNEAIWGVEDDQLLDAIRKHIADLSGRPVNV